MFHPNQLRTGDVLELIAPSHRGRLPRRRLHLQGRANRVAPSRRVLRGRRPPPGETADRVIAPEPSWPIPLSKESSHDRSTRLASSRAFAPRRRVRRRRERPRHRLADVLVDAGMTIPPADAALLDDLIGILPFIVVFAVITIVAGVGLLAGSSWTAPVALASALVAVIVGGFGLLLIVVGRDPFVPVASPASAPTASGSSPRSPSSTPRPRRPRGGRTAADLHLGSYCMTSSSTLPRNAHRRGTRGFAAIVTLLAGSVVLGVGAAWSAERRARLGFVSWLVPLTRRLRARALRRRLRADPRPRLERRAGRLPRDDRHRRRGLRPAADRHRARPVRCDQLAAVRPGVGRRRRSAGLDDRRVARRGPVCAWGRAAGARARSLRPAPTDRPRA